MYSGLERSSPAPEAPRKAKNLAGPSPTDRPKAMIGTRRFRDLYGSDSGTSDTDAGSHSDPKIPRNEGQPTLTTCQECGRAFTTKIGLSLHRRNKPFRAYYADIISRAKPHWSEEENYLLAKMEMTLITENRRNMNELLREKLPHRSLESIKSNRKAKSYKELLQQLLNTPQIDFTFDTGIAQDETNNIDLHASAREKSTNDDCPPGDTSYSSRERICKELERLTRKPPPRGFQGPRLWEITEAYISGRNISHQFNNYLRDNFYKDVPRNRHKNDPTTTPPGKKKAQRRHEYARTRN